MTPTQNKIAGTGVLLLLSFAIALFAADAPAEQTATPTPATTEATAEPKKPLEGTVVINSAEEFADPYADEEAGEEETSAPSFRLEKNDSTGFLTIDAPSESIREIVRKVADLYDLNIVIPTGLTGTTSLKLHNVSWQQLFEVMLLPEGFAYVEDKNIILIKSREEISAEPTQTRVFLVNHASASDLLASISPLIDSSNGGRIQVDKRSNALVISERPSRFNNISEIIERLDRPTPQVMIESKFIEVTDSDTKNLGVNWSSLSSYKLAVSGIERNWSHTHNDATDGTFTSWADTAVFSAPEFDVVLSALNDNSGSNLVSNPTVVALNNTEALINIGMEYPIPEYSYNQENGVFEVSGFEYKPIGINLKVRPQVNSQGFITLDIAPEVSSKTGEVDFGSTSSGTNGASIPVISTRKTSSTITVKDGYTLAIGGLIEVTKTTAGSSVPILGSLPLVGGAFKSSSDEVTRRNLIIFITARTVSPDGSGRPSIDPRQMSDMGLSEADLPGYTPTAEEQKLLDELAAKREAAKRADSVRKLRGELIKHDEPETTRKIAVESSSRAHR